MGLPCDLRDVAVRGAAQVPDPHPVAPQRVLGRGVLPRGLGECAAAQGSRNQGRHWESANEWQKALELDPDNPKIKHELAVSLYLKRDYDAAKAVIDELLKKEPQSGELNYLAGAILLYKQQAERALPFLENAVQLSPELTGAHSALGRAYMSLGEAAKAIPHLKEGLSSDEDGSLHFQLAQAYQRTGQKELARRTLAKYQEITKALQSEQKKLGEEVKIIEATRIHSSD